jgi:hypothetical protein
MVGRAVAGRAKMTPERQAGKELGESMTRAATAVSVFMAERLSKTMADMMQDQKDALLSLIEDFMTNLAPRHMRRLHVHDWGAVGEEYRDSEDEGNFYEEPDDELPPKAVRDGGYCNTPFEERLKGKKSAKKVPKKNAKKRGREEEEEGEEMEGEHEREESASSKKRKTGGGKGAKKKKTNGVGVANEEAVSSSCSSSSSSSSSVSSLNMPGNLATDDASPSTMDIMRSARPPPTGASIFEAGKN